MLVRADESVGRNIYFWGRYEQEDSEYFIRSVQKSDVCIDIGANVGFYTLALARQAANGTVHAFEPVPLNRDLLSVNILTNGFSNVTINQLVVGDREEDTELYVADDGAFSSLVDTERRPIKDKIQARMITLDHYCETQGLERVDVLKIDVEGAEEKVINGAKTVLSNGKSQPRLIMLELNEPMLCKFGSSRRRILTLMSDNGYNPFVVYNGESVPYESQHHDCFENVFFLGQEDEH